MRKRTTPFTATCYAYCKRCKKKVWFENRQLCIRLYDETECKCGGTIVVKGVRKK